MSVDYRAFADIANNLLSGVDEISWRMAAGRTYYASYHRSLQSVQHCPDNAHLAMGSHERVTDRFISQGSVGAKSIAYVLQAMKKVRHVADYDINEPFEKCSAENQLCQHKLLVQRLENFDKLMCAKSA